MPTCLKCGRELPVNEEGIAPVLCDRCAGAATSRARRSLSVAGTMNNFPATTALTAINLAVFVWMVVTTGSVMDFSLPDLVQAGANVGPLTYSGQYWRLVTAGFIHGGLFHIAMNMWCLWSLGQLAERLFGSWITFAIYILTGVAGSMLSIGYAPGRVEVGASGAVFGIAGAILSGVKFGHVAVSPMQKRSIFSSLIFFVVINLTIGLAPGVDNMCHLGGLLAGVAFGAPLSTAMASGKKTFQWATILLAALILSVVGRQLVSARAAESKRAVAQISVQNRDYATAVKMLEDVTAADPNDAESQAFLGYAYQMNNQNEKAVAAYKRALQLDPNNKDARQGLDDLQGNAGSDSEK